MTTPKTELPEAEQAPAAALAADPMATYRDTVFTSRTLILPDHRTLHVLRGRVAVPKADTLAVNYLKAHNELELLKE